MMETIKWFTGKTFHGAEFADMLVEKLNCKAIVVTDGIILDREAFNAIPVHLLPHWALINRRYINSELHTRPATQAETFRLEYGFSYTSGDHMLGLASEGKDPIYILRDKREEMIRQAKDCARFVKDCERVIVVDMGTGEVVYEVQL